ncbi:hypothetical protein [Fimbriimonas ginsengisoli]|nr:hypothetical protein [Fimbriimonas ginsengisoli]
MNSKISRVLAVALCAAALVGTCLAQGGGGQRGNRQGRGARNGPPSLTQLALRSDVQADLAVTDDQKTKLAELRPQRGNRANGGAGAGGGAGAVGGGGAGVGGGAVGGGGQRGNRAPVDPAVLAERRAAEKKALEAVLNADQMKRLEEIRIQVAGDQAILDPEVQKTLSFTDDQKAKVKEVQDKYRSAMTTMREKMQNGDLDRQGMQEAMKTNNKVLGEELHKILTPAQADQLKTLGGKPFKADAPTGRGGR